MKRAQLIGLSIAGVAGVAAFILMKGMVNQKPETRTRQVVVDSTEVLVASKDIRLGEVVTEHHFKWQKWPKSGVHPGLITSSRRKAKFELAGSIARAPLLAGEPATAKKLIKAGQGGVLAAILPSGMRAVSTRIEQKTAVGGLVLPNDHVDVILIRRKQKQGGSEEYISDTLFRNVRVLAIGQRIETAAGEKTAESNGAVSTATLELSPRQAELLALANTMGELTLSLRSVADIDEDNKNVTGVLNKDRGSSIGVTRYGVQSRAYGVN